MFANWIKFILELRSEPCARDNTINTEEDFFFCSLVHSSFLNLNSFSYYDNNFINIL